MSGTQPQQPDDGRRRLALATQALREQPEPGWPGVADAVVRRVREVGRTSRPLVVHDQPEVDEAVHGGLRVAEHVVTDALRRALREVPRCRPVGVRLDVVDGRVGAAHVEVAVAYGSDVRAVAATARSAVATVLPAVVGPVAALPVEVAVVDVLPPA